jgi:hypothetical protein
VDEHAPALVDELGHGPRRVGEHERPVVVVLGGRVEQGDGQVLDTGRDVGRAHPA